MEILLNYCNYPKFPAVVNYIEGWIRDIEEAATSFQATGLLVSVRNVCRFVGNIVFQIVAVLSPTRLYVGLLSFLKSSTGPPGLY